MKSVAKKEYRAPKLKVHGALETITQHAGSGSILDASFPSGTPFGDLTFS